MKRITKSEAKKRFSNGEIIYLCPCKLSPHGPFSSACSIHSKEWLESKDGDFQQAWQTMYRNWEYYNASYETGYYAHYYIEE